MLKKISAGTAGVNRQETRDGVQSAVVEVDEWAGHRDDMDEGGDVDENA